jgi:integrase
MLDRVGDARLAGLRWSDLDLDSRMLSVRRNRVAVGYKVVEGEPRTGRARTVELDDATVAELRAHRKRQLEGRLAWGEAWTDSGLVFTRENGEPLQLQTISQGFERRASAAALPPLPFHCVRHAHATLALRAGVPAKVVQERLGHANISITLDLYSHVVPGMQRDAAAQVAALLFGDERK